MMFGVSPAFVLSLHGQDFSVDDFCEALPRIGRLGFTAYQPEVFHAAGYPVLKPQVFVEPRDGGDG